MIIKKLIEHLMILFSDSGQLSDLLELPFFYSVKFKPYQDRKACAFLELSNDGRKGYRNIRATFRVKSDDSPEPEILKELAEFSPFLDVVANRSPLSLRIEKA
jgi:hypothetical protein